MTRPEDLIDLKRYPLGEPEGGKRLTEHTRKLFYGRAA